MGLCWALRDAKDHSEAKLISDRLESVLKNENLSALKSYLEAKEDLLVIHELKLSYQLKTFSKMACYVLFGFRKENAQDPWLPKFTRPVGFTSQTD